MKEFTQKTFDADFCVVGGGMAGLCAAIAAARLGARVVLMHEPSGWKRRELLDLQGRGLDCLRTPESC